MKHLCALLLCCLLLCGCGAEASREETESTTSPIAATTDTTPAAAMYDPGSTLEVSTKGALLAYPLTMPDVYGIIALGDDLLLFSGEENTALTLLTGDSLSVSAVAELDFSLSAQDPSLRICGQELSYFDPVRHETVVLNEALKAVSHIAAPADLAGSPILSADRNTLYYCTSTALRAWDLESGIRRTLKEMTYTSQSPVGLYLEDSVVQCRILDGTVMRTQFLSTQNGQLLYEHDSDAISMSESGERYYISFPTGVTQALLFGTAEAEPQALIPEDIFAPCFFLEDSHAAVAIQELSDDELRLEYYDLESGMKTAALTLPSQHLPTAVEDAAGYVCILTYDPDYDCQTIYRWDTGNSPVTDKTVYTGVHYTKKRPDLQGLTQCLALAQDISSRHGIQVEIWEDALNAQPWDYDFEGEYMVPVIQEELQKLDQCLSQYPEGMLAQTASHFTALKIFLVRQITGTAESGSLETVTGVQFLDGTDACVAIAAGKYSAQALYHELFHVMETHIWDESIAFDQWDKLNPAGFAYDYDYAANARRDSGVYLHTENRAFVDTYSMSFPKEDRARIMEYAMLPGNEELFRPQLMQAKLKALCDGIREAYGLEKAKETFLWEQYLE